MPSRLVLVVDGASTGGGNFSPATQRQLREPDAIIALRWSNRKAFFELNYCLTTLGGIKSDTAQFSGAIVPIRVRVAALDKLNGEIQQPAIRPLISLPGGEALRVNNQTELSWREFVNHIRPLLILRLVEVYAPVLE